MPASLARRVSVSAGIRNEGGVEGVHFDDAEGGCGRFSSPLSHLAGGLLMSTRVSVSISLLACVLLSQPAFPQDEEPPVLRELRESQRVQSGSAQGIATVEPGALDFGELHRGDNQTKTVRITNVSTDPIRINRAFATCGCTVPTVPDGWINPGESVEVGIELTAKSPGAAHSNVKFFLDEAKGELTVAVSGYVKHPIVADPAIYESELESDLDVTLSSTDGNEFQIMAVDPPVLDGVDDERRTVHHVKLNAARLKEAGARKFRIRVYTDHPRIDSILLRSDRIQATDEVTAYLAWARGSGDVVDLAQYMESGLAVDAPDPQGRTALMFAALVGDVDRVRALLDFGADVNAVTTDKRTPLMHAAQTSNGNGDALMLLLDAGSDVNARDQFGRTALFWAARGADAERIRILIERGGDVNVQGPSNETPLTAAVKSQRPENVSILLEAGADPRVPDSKGRRPIDHAKVFQARTRTQEQRENAEEIVRILEDLGQ